MFETVFGRAASSEELDRVSEFLDSADQPARLHRTQLALWSLLTSAEFQLNH